MGEAEDDPQWKYWYQFMKKKAVLPKSLCSKYATQFTDNDVKVDQLTEVVEDDLVFLRHVGVDKAGHAMRIRTEARKLGYNTAQVEEVQLVKIDEVDETREGGAESTLEEEDGRFGEDGGSTTVVGEGEEESREVSGGSSMAEEDSPSTVLVSQTCYHGLSETCVNCFICNKHLNTKSLPKHILNQHQLLTVPVSKKRTSTSATLPPVPVEGQRGQSFSAPQPSDDEENYEENYDENDEDAIGIVPPLAGFRESRPSVANSSRKHPSETVQGMVKATGKQDKELLRVKVNGNKKPVKNLKEVSGEEPILLSLKKVVQKVHSGRQPSSHKKPFRTVRKLKHPQWVVLEPRTNSTKQASQAEENKSAQANSSLQKADFVTGISRFGRERKRKKIQSC